MSPEFLAEPAGEQNQAGPPPAAVVVVEVDPVIVRRYVVQCTAHGEVWVGRNYTAAHDTRAAHEAEHE